MYNDPLEHDIPVLTGEDAIEFERKARLAEAKHFYHNYIGGEYPEDKYCLMFMNYFEYLHSLGITPFKVINVIKSVTISRGGEVKYEDRAIEPWAIVK